MNRAPRIGLLLINREAPTSPEVSDVGSFALRLLMDERVLGAERDA